MSLTSAPETSLTPAILASRRPFENTVNEVVIAGTSGWRALVYNTGGTIEILSSTHVLFCLLSI